MCSISSMVSERSSLERDFGIPVSDSASVVSTGMASECLFFSAMPSLLFSSQTDNVFLCHVIPSRTPSPFFSLPSLEELKVFLSRRSEEERPQFITITTSQQQSSWCGIQYSHLHDVFWLVTVTIVPLHLIYVLY